MTTKEQLEQSFDELQQTVNVACDDIDKLRAALLFAVNALADISANEKSRDNDMLASSALVTLREEYGVRYE